MYELFERSAWQSSKGITHLYSTSFGKGIQALDVSLRNPVYGIYGFVRFADEIVDTFYQFDQRLLMEEFIRETYLAIDRKISLNPVLHAFQSVVNEYGIEKELIDAFFTSMKMDLDQKQYEAENYRQYIYGSAEVVGLMCLRVFTRNSQSLYDELKPFARRLGAAFQKVNFLRDVQSDFLDRGRVYFPGVDFGSFDREMKSKIEEDIAADFEVAYVGILKLPREARAGVYLAYKYYRALFRQIQKVEPARILKERIRVGDNKKLLLMAESYFRIRLNLV
jgi:phytoene/squalene synthetase